MPYNNDLDGRASANRPPRPGAIFSTGRLGGDLGIDPSFNTDTPGRRVEAADPAAAAHASLLEEHEILKAQVASLLRTHECQLRSSQIPQQQQREQDSMIQATLAEIAKFDGKANAVQL
ncbi:MAG: hypothetical protein BJ554DRAFT_1520 [Olpidium bornovanus]|uniref:Uncharacterized protein n=1 Tax=Olpidium bornovanus TaxID=278681 RepID=A0A8H8A1D7_9FUNG|nr:MAG: hypothetical protein BJ554DRAFT_1520 [Olpidium bornovanus]